MVDYYYLVVVVVEGDVEVGMVFDYCSLQVIQVSGIVFVVDVQVIWVGCQYCYFCVQFLEDVGSDFVGSVVGVVEYDFEIVEVGVGWYVVFIEFDVVFCCVIDL